MNNKHFFYLFSGIIGGFIAVLLCSNYYVDYYGVFRGAQHDVIESNQINDHWVKLEYLLDEKNFNKYDSYLFGSSRVQKMDTMLTGEKTYNLGFSKGMPEDYLDILKEMVKMGIPIKKVYIGIDDFSYMEIPPEADFRVNYSKTGTRKYEYYMELLCNISNLRTWIGEIRGHRAIARNMIGTTGAFIVPDRIEMNIECNSDHYVVDKKFWEPTEYPYRKKEQFTHCVESLKQIKLICDENGIQLFVFFNPQHMTTYLNDDIQLMNKFKKELVKISPFWDFSGVNYVTANNYFWYETSHPRAFICDKILDIVSGQNQITWVPDFGVYVTPDNVDAFCEKAVRDREAYDPHHEQWIPSVEERTIMTKRVNYSW